MALEVATYINGLDVTNPTATDPKSQGDDHLRLVKTALKATFPNVTGAVTASQTELNLLAGQTGAISFPVGTRMPFAQAAAPTGWTQDVSDNANNRMLRVVSAGGGAVGGSSSPILNNVVPSHTHGFTTGNMSADHTHGIADPGHSHYVPNQGGASANSTGSGAGTYNHTPATLYTDASATGIWTNSASANHTHSGGTDNGSSQTNWTPRYIDMIICSKQ